MKPVTGRLLRGTFSDLAHPSLAAIGSYARLLSSTVRSRIAGAPDFSSEIFHWERYYDRCQRSAKKPASWYPERWKGRYAPGMKAALGILLQEYEKSDVRILDVGSGPVMTSDTLDITEWAVTHVDPLADTYNRLNRKYGVRYPFRCVRGYGESLGELFEKESFHLVISQNSMDHSASPKAFIDSLYYVLKPGGFMFLSGFMNEGEMKNWWGMHKHNLLMKEGDDDIYWTSKDKSIDGFNLTKDLRVSVFKKWAEGYHPGAWYRVMYRKAGGGMAVSMPAGKVNVQAPD